MDEIIYFNNAATTWPKPKEVIDYVADSLKLPYHEHGRATSKKIIDYPIITRKKLNEFFNGDNYKHFQFTSNATDSLNLLIHGYVKNFDEKIHVITTELEHNSVLRPLNTLNKEKKIDLTIIPFNKKGYIALESIEENIRHNTELVVLNHGSNVIGTVQNIKEIGNYLNEKNIFFIVDIAQTAGHIPIDLTKIKVDALVFTGHKSMFGFQGIGGFYIKDPTKVKSYKQGGTGIISQYPYHPKEMPLKYEFGTLNYPGIVSLYAGIDFVQKIGLKKIEEKTKVMTEYIVNQLSNFENIKIYNKNPDLPVISLNIEGLGNDDLGFILMNEYSIMTRTGLHCAPLVHKKIDGQKGCLRISLSYFNTIEQCEYFTKILKKIALNMKNKMMI